MAEVLMGNAERMLNSPYANPGNLAAQLGSKLSVTGDALDFDPIEAITSLLSRGLDASMYLRDLFG